MAKSSVSPWTRRIEDGAAGEYGIRQRRARGRDEPHADAGRSAGAELEGCKELDNLKPHPTASLILHKSKLEYTIYMCNYGCSSVTLPSQNKVCNL
jgi:hypothetical protein